MIFHY